MKSEHSFEAVMARLKAAAAVSSDGQIAEKLGLSSSAYANLKKRGSIPYEKANALALSQNVNLHWLYTGQGEPDPALTLPTAERLSLPNADKILGLIESLNARQLRQLESILEDFQAWNRLNEEVERLRQRLGLAPDPSA